VGGQLKSMAASCCILNYFHIRRISLLRIFDFAACVVVDMRFASFRDNEPDT
jgi:hypothetical protein